MIKIFYLNEFDDLFNDGFLNKKTNLDETKLNKEVEEGEDENYKWKKETWSSADGSFFKTKTYYTPKFLSKKELSLLKKELELAVKEERYEDAAKIRDEIKSIDK
jgi:excinuclease UvrABC helicase subunit UvrB